MLDFDEQNPYPLVEDFNAALYGPAQAHAARVDAWLDLRTGQTESALACDERDVINADGIPQQLWLGLPVAALLTPYIELRWMLNLLDLRAGDTIVDCGAGYGRLAFVLERHYPELNFHGYEYVRERVIETNRVFAARGLRRSLMTEADLSHDTCQLAPAEHYFIYDFGSIQAIRKLLANLQTLGATKALSVIGRGRLVRDCIERGHPWLSQVVPPRHFAHFSIYSSGLTR